MKRLKEILTVALNTLRHLYREVSIPILFGYVLFLCLHRNLRIGATELVLVILCVAEPILILTSKYFVTLKFGKDGFQIGFKTGLHSTEPIILCNEAPPVAPDAEQPTQSKEPFSSLSNESKMLLRTLWVNQKKNYGQFSEKRWAFTQHLFDEDKFRKGVSEQAEKGRVSLDQNDMAYLTLIGLDYCRRFDADISSYPIHFGPPGN